MKKKTKKAASRKTSASVKHAKKTAVKSAPVSANTTGVQPLGERVLVRPLSPEESGRILASGIIIPETIDKEKPAEGRVVAVGAGKRTEDGTLIPLSVKVGDKVMFSKYGYDEVKVGGIEYFIVSESSILAILQ